MKFKGASWTKSIFVRLLLMFILILLPLFAIGYSIYNWGINTVKYEITSSMQAQIDFYRNNLDQEFQRIRILQYDMLNDASLNTLVTSGNALSEYDKDMNLIRVQQRINAIQSSSRYISEVKVIIPNLNKTINTPSILDMGDADRILVKASSDPDLKIHYMDGRLFMNVDSSSVLKKAENVETFYIFIFFSPNELGKMLYELNTYEGSGSFIYNEPSHLKIDSTANKALSDELIDYYSEMKPTNTDQAMQNGAGSNENYFFKLDKKQYLVSYASMNSLGLTMVRYIPVAQIFQKIDEFRTLFLFFSITALIITVIFSFSTYRVIHRPLSKLVKAFYRVEKGDFTVVIKHNRQDEFNHIYERFNSMLSNLNSLIDQVYKQRILLQNAELKQLQTQINPHFLYNSFFILHRWIQRGYKEESIKFSKQLGSYFQFITRSAADEIPLAREIEHARTYTEIQLIRFSNRIEAVFADLPDALGHIMVPRLLVQPIIENAFEHGLESMEKGGKLQVNFEVQESLLLLIVEDNGISLTDLELEEMKQNINNKDEQIEMTGMLNIHRRVRLKYGDASGVEFSRSNLGGLKVTLKIEIKGE